MKELMRIGLCVGAFLGVWLLLWLAFGFVAWDFNPAHWDFIASTPGNGGGRFFYVLFGLPGSIGLAFHAYTKDQS
jgi:hypothetical protein